MASKQDEPRKAYYAVIPATVRYSPHLKAAEKLLYGEITSLCNQEGFCWASNKHFCDLYDVDQATVSRWIGNLVNNGFVRAQYQESNLRRLYLTEMVFMARDLETPAKKPKREPKGMDILVARSFPGAIDTPEVRSAWERFRAFRLESKKKLTPLAEVAALKRLLELSGGNPETAIKVIDQSIANSWQGIFALKGQSNVTTKQARGYNGFDNSKYPTIREGVGGTA
jgi:hypothetical protein